MRLVLPLLALAAALLPQEPAAPPPQSPAPAPPLDAEPPALFALRCGEDALQFRDGERFVLPAAWGGQECSLERLPLRRFEFPGALAFDYPDGANWIAAVHVPEFLWWHVGVGREFALLQRHRGTGDAAHHRDLCAGNCLKAGGEDLGECGILLGGREVRGRRVSGFSDHAYVQEIFGFEHAGETWLLVLNHGDPAPAPRPLRDRLLGSFRFL